MADGAREEILANIRNALAGETNPHRPASKRRDKATSDRGPAENARSELVKRFESEFARIGGKLYRAADATELRQSLNEIAIRLGAKRVIAWARSDLQDSGVFDSLKDAGIEVRAAGKAAERDDLVRDAALADIGITAVDYALADTGTLVVFAAPDQPRCVSLLPTVHVAILPVEKMLPGLDELISVLASGRGPAGHGLSSAVTFITGPSRTADIELTLVVGVHGPQQLYVILLGDDQDGR
jgi:L-lactate dehydrogenase complex protein LldG